MNLNLPSEYLHQMQDLLQEDYPAYLDSFFDQRVYGLRVNTLKISVEDFLKISPFQLTPIPWCKNGFYYDGTTDQPAKHPYYFAGLYYLQEPSAMIAAEILPIEENDKVLDGCAAPGGKSSEIAAKLKGTGVLISNDISASRCQGLVKNLELFGVNNAYVTCCDLTKMQQVFDQYFDKILLDVPCSGEGMFRKDPSLIKSWKERGNSYYCDIQKKIVASALKMLKPGGKMVYSTCTFSSQEDEEVIQYMLSLCPELKVLPIENRYPKFAQGVYPGLEDAIRIYPFKVRGEGHFAVLLQKGEKIETEQRTDDLICSEYHHSAVDEFFQDVKCSLPKGRMINIADKIYYLVDTQRNLSAIRMIRSGLLLGSLKKNRFEPSNALALALKKKEYARVIDFASTDERVIKYLKGETIDATDIDSANEGYVLICVDGFSLGWGKIQKGLIKNKIEVGFRWQ